MLKLVSIDFQVIYKMWSTTTGTLNTEHCEAQEVTVVCG